MLGVFRSRRCRNTTRQKNEQLLSHRLMNAQPSRAQIQAKLARLVQAGYVPILLDNAVDPLLVCEVACEAGLPAVEYTLRRRDHEMLPIMRKEFGDLLLLVGSVIDRPEVVRFVQSRRPFHAIEQLYDLGVDGIVSFLPFREQTYQWLAGKMLLAPGVATAAAGFEQLAMGADLIKIVGMEPNLITAMEDATQCTLPILATGVSLDQVDETIRCGALVMATSLERTLGPERFSSFLGKPDRKALLDRLLEYKAEIAAARRALGLAWDDLDDPAQLLAATGRYYHGWENHS